MADELFMSINEPWDYEDDMSNYAATGWTVGSGGLVTQLSGYVRINQSAGSDLIQWNSSSKTLPYTVETQVVSKGSYNGFVSGDGSNRIYVYFPDTGGAMKYYRIVVRAHSSGKGNVLLYENGQLIKNQADLVQSSTDTFWNYQVTDSAVSGDFLEVYHHRHTYSADFGQPPSDNLLTTIYLDGRAGYELLFQRLGAWMPPRNFIEDQIPFQPGSLWRQTIIEPRDISIGIKALGTSKSDLNTKIRSLLKTIRDPCKLVVKMSDGYRYLSPCRYLRGLEGEETPDVTGQLAQKLTATFRAFDPYWTWTASGSSPVLTLFISNPSSTNTVTVNGDIDTWPEFFISGPGNNPTITNLTTGKAFALSVSLPTNNDYIYINTKPGQRTIKDKNGNTAWSSLSTTSNTFFSLIPGTNRIQVQYTSGTDTTTNVKMAYYERFLGV